jgi:hypothetical protein
MADRFCPSCGTEVEADARFCPSCGTTLPLEGAEPQADVRLPPAPTWPADEAEPAAAPGLSPGDEPTLTDGPTAEPGPPPVAEPVVEAQPEPSAPAPSPGPASPAAQPAAHSVTPVARSSDIPVTWPTTVAGWLIGAGSLLGAIFLIATLGNVVSLLLFVALLGVATTIFVADRIPEIPHLRLLVLVTTMIGLGVGLARAGFTVNGVDTLFLLAMLAAGGGALLIEIDRDRPWPPLERGGG